MNERIKKLFKQAGGKTSTRNLMSNPVQVVETHELWDDRIEKFAKLLIDEAIVVMVKHDYHGEWLGSKLKEHFGVEE